MLAPDWSVGPTSPFRITAAWRWWAISYRHLICLSAVHQDRTGVRGAGLARGPDAGAAQEVGEGPEKMPEDHPRQSVCRLSDSPGNSLNANLARSA